MRRTIITALAVLLAACGSGDSGETPDTTAPPDDDAIVLEVTSEGGFMPVGAQLDTTPRYLLTADRSLYHQGPVPEMFPGPLLPNIQVTTLSEPDYEEVLRLIEEIGFADFEERTNDDSADRIADAGTDVFRYHDESGVHRYSVYALGLEQSRDPDLVLLGEILDVLGEATGSADAEPYRGERLQVIAGPAVDTIDPGMMTEAEWPLDTPFADMDAFAMDQRCVVLDGAAADAALEVFADADQGHRWGPEGLAIRARPLLPDEEGCEVPERLQEGAGSTTG